MTPKLTYKLIIENAKRRNSDNIGPYEIHHIKPRCMGGSDNVRNLVKLTLREHYFVHYLLSKIYPNSNIAIAYLLMTKSGKYGKVISSRQYERVKLHLAKINKKTVKECNKSRCLVFMWRYLCKIGDTNPTDETILKGWKNRTGFQSNKWRECFKSNKDWITNVKLYIKENPIDVNFTFKRQTGMNNQQLSRMVNTFIKRIEDKQFWHNIEPNKDGKWTITKTFIVNARYYYPEGRCWKTINWKKYTTKKDWLNKIISKLSTLQYDYVIYKF